MMLPVQCVPGTVQSDSLIRACVGKRKPKKEGTDFEDEERDYGVLDIVDCTAGFGHDSLRIASAGQFQR